METSCIHEYGISFPREYTIDLVSDIGKTMNIPVDIERLKAAMNNDGGLSEKTLCIFDDPGDERCFIMVDCVNADYLYGICVRCSDEINQKAKGVLLYWDTRGRREYGQIIQEDIKDTINREKSIYDSIVEWYSPFIPRLRH